MPEEPIGEHSATEISRPAAFVCQGVAYAFPPATAEAFLPGN